MVKLHRYIVAGHGPFPVCMLVVDQCWPANLTSAEAIRDQENLTTKYVRLDSHKVPDVALWERMGWRYGSPGSDLWITVTGSNV